MIEKWYCVTRGMLHRCTWCVRHIFAVYGQFTTDNGFVPIATPIKHLLNCPHHTPVGTSAAMYSI